MTDRVLNKYLIIDFSITVLWLVLLLRFYHYFYCYQWVETCCTVCCIIFCNVVFSSAAVVQRCSVKKVLLEISQNSQENPCARVSFLIKLQAWGLKETLALVFSCEFCEISKNTFFYKTPPVAASVSFEVLICFKLLISFRS